MIDVVLEISLAPYDSVWWWLNILAAGVKAFWMPLLFVAVAELGIGWLKAKADRAVASRGRARHS